MAEHNYRVRVFVKNVKPEEPGREDATKAFNIQTSNPDKAAALARSRLEGAGLAVLGLSHGPERSIVVSVSREPRGGPPKTVTARVVQQPRAKRSAPGVRR